MERSVAGVSMDELSERGEYGLGLLMRLGAGDDVKDSGNIFAW